MSCWAKNAVGSFDLITIGDDTRVGADTILSGGVVEEGLLKIGPINIGKRCRIGNRCVLRPWASMMEASSLEDLTLLRSENRVRAGKHRAGSPAAPFSGAKVRADAANLQRPGIARRIVFSLLAGLSVFLFPVIPLAALIPGFLLLRTMAATLGGYWFLLFTPVATALFILLFVLEIFLLEVGAGGPGQAGYRYPLYGWFQLPQMGRRFPDGDAAGPADSDPHQPLPRAAVSAAGGAHRASTRNCPRAKFIVQSGPARRWRRQLPRR